MALEIREKDGVSYVVEIGVVNTFDLAQMEVELTQMIEARALIDIQIADKQAKMFEIQNLLA